MGVKIELSQDEIDIILEGLTRDISHYQSERKKASAKRKKTLDTNFSTTKKLYDFFKGL